jgi:membrane-bound lytic murein transglycosylase MltF
MNESSGVPPMVIDLGKQRKSRLKDLKRGRGKLVAEVAEVMDRVRAELGPDAANKQLIPVVLVYQKKSKRRRRGLALPLPFP